MTLTAARRVTARLPSTVPGPLRSRRFRLLWTAGLVSDAGDWLLFVALPVVVYQLTGSAFGTSVAFLIELGPPVLLAPLAGWCADRWDRCRLMVGVSVLQAVTLLPLLSVHGRGDLPVLYGVILAESVLLTFFDPAKNAVLPTLVRPAELVSANSLIALNQNLGRLVGGPLGGVLLALGGLRWITVADLVSYLLAAALIARAGATRPAEPVTGAVGPGGGSVPWRQRRIVGGLVVTLIGQIAQGIFMVLFVLFVAQRLHGGSSEIGTLRGVQAIGAITGGLALSALARRWSPGALCAAAATAFGVLSWLSWNAPAVTTSGAVYFVLFVLVGAPGIVFVTGIISVVQQATTDGQRGRVFAAFGLASALGQAIGMLGAGLLTATVGLMTMLDAQAGIYLLAGALAAVLLARPDRSVQSVQ